MYITFEIPCNLCNYLYLYNIQVKTFKEQHEQALIVDATNDRSPIYNEALSKDTSGALAQAVEEVGRTSRSRS